MPSRKYALFGYATMSLLLAICAAGCGQSGAGRDSSFAAGEAEGVDAGKYLLTEEPDGAMGVIAAREESKDGDEIVLLGRIGGSKRPWIEGRSAFTVIDAAMMVVGDGQESGSAQVCLDDCCAGLRAECTTLVKLVDEQGQVLPIDARHIVKAQVDELVIIRGHIQRNDEEGSFVVLADGVYVRR